MRARHALVRGLAVLAVLLAATTMTSAAPLFAERASPSAAAPARPVADRTAALPAASEAAAPQEPTVAATLPTETLGVPLARPAQPVIVAAYRTAPVADHCLDRDLPAAPVLDPIYTVLDRSYALPADYAPPDLVSVAQAGFASEELVRAIVIADLASLREASAAAGLEIIVESGYRSYAAQAVTLAYWIGVEGPEAGARRTARPGHSEHQLGTAIDVTSPGWSGRFGDWGTESPDGAWMVEHAWEHGFVMSYPGSAESVTCFTYEPWHYRWVGREAAAAQRASGEVLRLFLVRYLTG